MGVYKQNTLYFALLRVQLEYCIKFRAPWLNDIDKHAQRSEKCGKGDMPATLLKHYHMEDKVSLFSAVLKGTGRSK